MDMDEGWREAEAEKIVDKAWDRVEFGGEADEFLMAAIRKQAYECGCTFGCNGRKYRVWRALSGPAMMDGLEGWTLVRGDPAVARML